MQTYHAGMSGSLFKLPGGPLGAAVGAELRHERRQTQTDHDSTEQRFTFFLGSTDSNASRDVLSGYAELRWPCWTGIELQTALRVERYTDIDAMLRYIAVDRTIAVDDGPFHWYCSGGTCRNHNYYWYETENHDKLWLIPWDLDGSFNLDNPVITIWMPWDDTGLACSGQTQPPFEVPLRPPACDKLTLGWATMQQRWLNVVRDLQAHGVKVLYEIDDYIQGARKTKSHELSDAFDEKVVRDMELVMRVCDGTASLRALRTSRTSP